jgi:hypothetical protein
MDSIIEKLRLKRASLATDLYLSKISERTYFILTRKLNSKELKRKLFLSKGDNNGTQ